MSSIFNANQVKVINKIILAVIDQATRFAIYNRHNGFGYVLAYGNGAQRWFGFCEDGWTTMDDNGKNELWKFASIDDCLEYIYQSGGSLVDMIKVSPIIRDGKVIGFTKTNNF